MKRIVIISAIMLSSSCFAGDAMVRQQIVNQMALGFTTGDNLQKYHSPKAKKIHTNKKIERKSNANLQHLPKNQKFPRQKYSKQENAKNSRRVY